MAHEMSINGQGQVEAVFGYGEVPWWNSSKLIATVLPGAVDFDSIFTIAFPWHAEMEQLQYADGSLSSQAGIRRSDTKYELGVHSLSYGNIQPKDLFEFCASFFKEHPEVPISSALAMSGGKVLNISCRLGEINILGSGDIHKSYLCFVNSYNGRFKAQVYKSYIQPVCMNTTRAGLASADFKMSYKHSKNVRQTIEHDGQKASSLMAQSEATDVKVKEVLEALAMRKPTRQAFETILNELFGKEDSNRIKNTKTVVTDFIANGINAQKFPDFKMTGYGIYTALTDYADHASPIKITQGRASQSEEEIRVERNLLGESATFKEKALTVLETILIHTDGTLEASPVQIDMKGKSVKKHLKGAVANSLN
jgi:phage/plasmid-like protein (TIGR03299 family)